MRPIKILIWNMAGLKNKQSDFWKFIYSYDVIMMMETWMEEKDWNVWVQRLSTEFNWERVSAERMNIKGRAAGGIIMGIRKIITEEEPNFVRGRQTLKWTWKVEGKELNLIAVYKRLSWEILEDDMQQQMGSLEDREDSMWIVAGDFNARIGTEEIMVLEDGSEIERISRDDVCNGEGRKMLRWMEEEGLVVLNGWYRGDEKGEFTHIGEGYMLSD